MVSAIFLHSRKMMTLPEARRSELRSDVERTTTIDELKQLAISSLEHSMLFTVQIRDRIANCILDDRYDLLLLPNAFDCCDEACCEEAASECPVCLGEGIADQVLPC